MQWSTSSPQTRFTVWDSGLCDILSKVPARRRQAFRVFCCHIFKKSEYLLSTSFYQHVWFLGLHSRSPAVMSAGICFLLFASLCICCVDLHGCVWMCIWMRMDLHDVSAWICMMDLQNFMISWSVRIPLPFHGHLVFCFEKVLRRYCVFFSSTFVFRSLLGLEGWFKHQGLASGWLREPRVRNPNLP